MFQIILVRHAETTWNRQRRYYTGQDDPGYTGQDDPGLTTAGEREAALLRPHLATYRHAQVLCSPALRARSTAALAGLEVEISADLREWNYQLPEGRTMDDGCPTAPCHHDVWNDAVRFEGCAAECVPEVTARADRVLARARCTLHSGQDVVLISHGNFIRILAARWVGLPTTVAAYLALRTASVGRLGDHDGRPSLLGWNFSPTFDTLSPGGGARFPVNGVGQPPSV
ncbi:histidine phosphatase family protein [Streptomyces sp. NPDC005708]|uniref:histidine phosphatase family protein n=1 Tax=unclassified Streptomyces TaxID=2593676 RepID=UPI0034035D17